MDDPLQFGADAARVFADGASPSQMLSDAVSVVSDVTAEPLLQNTCPVDVELFWVDYEGLERSYGVLRAGAERSLQTFEGHAWRIRTLDGEPIRALVARDGDPTEVCDADHTPGAAAFFATAPPRSLPEAASPRSLEQTELAIVNTCDVHVRLVWVDFRGQEREYGGLAPGAEATRRTYVGHLWRMRDDGGRMLREVRASDATSLDVCDRVLSRDA